MSRVIWLLLGLLLALAIPVWLGGGETVTRLKQFPLPQLSLMFGMIILCWLINSVRIRLLLGEQRGQLGRLNSLGVVISTEFAMCATPGGSGGPLTLMVLLARNGIRPAHGSAVFAMDQLSDLLFFSAHWWGSRCTQCSTASAHAWSGCWGSVRHRWWAQCSAPCCWCAFIAA